MPKDSGGLIMQPLDPKVYEELLKNYKQQLPKEEPKNDRN